MEKYYRSGNLQVLAYLLATGVKYDRTEIVNTNRVEFLFRDEDGRITKLADAYFRGAQCAAIDYYRALLELRVQISRTLGVSRG